MVGPEADAHYEATLASNLRCSRERCLDTAMDTHQLDALMAPAGPPAGETHPCRGGEDRLVYFGSSSAAAVAGYPIVSVPAGVWQVGGSGIASGEVRNDQERSGTIRKDQERSGKIRKDQEESGRIRKDQEGSGGPVATAHACIGLDSSGTHSGQRVVGR